MVCVLDAVDDDLLSYLSLPQVKKNYNVMVTMLPLFVSYKYTTESLSESLTNLNLPV